MKRFWDKVSKTENGCWLWTGCKHSFGYGQFSFDGRPIYAHRFSWEIMKGEIPKGLCILHKCDVPACVNPDHLFLGTKADNTNDMLAKGRNGFGIICGESHYQTTLTDDDIRKIRKDKRRQIDIAKNYNISQATVSSIKLRNVWKHVEDK